MTPSFSAPNALNGRICLRQLLLLFQKIATNLLLSSIFCFSSDKALALFIAVDGFVNTVCIPLIINVFLVQTYYGQVFLDSLFGHCMITETVSVLCLNRLQGVPFHALPLIWANGTPERGK